MSAVYNHKQIETKWRNIWKDNPINKDEEGKEKYYCLDMFPYPSGSGLHVGHWRGYVLSDVWSRYKVLQNYYVLHPMGWDAFGLPAENYAIKMGIHPSKATATNVENFKRQLKEISAIYDWTKEVNTTDPKYYKWTQWIFVKMFKEGLAYEKQMPINWCPDCKTGLANEEVVNGTCERCGAEVTKKNLRQWMLKITAYAERLLDDLQKLEWPAKVIKMQSDWIGKSYGAEIDFKVNGIDERIKVFTTRPDTLYGSTFMVLAPEHEMVSKLATEEQKEEVEKYVFNTSMKSSVDRLQDKEKTGVFTGSYAVNPLNGAKIPIWISDYVLADYGTGAIMCVPAHDDRDFAFAKKFDLPIIQVIAEDGKEIEDLQEAYIGEGEMINSDVFNGMKSSQSKEAIANYLEEHEIGKKTVNYKLRDWVFSRQRYWGEPIPIIHCEKCGAVPVPEDQLPVTLPNVESYEPTGTGESPLAAIDEWVNTTCPVCGGKAKRETNTMPQWAGSSWYFLRYIDVNNDNELVSKEKAKEWLPVDMYVGGIEHAVLHLLYARFYTKFLYDIGVVDFEEPFKRLFNQGMICKNGAKMSKSKGNVVSPDDLVEKYGCDSLRLYELFVGPPELDSEWDDRGIDGVYRYINKVWNLVNDNKDRDVKVTGELEKVRNQLIYEVTNRLDSFHLNTVVSAFMEYTNKLVSISKKDGGVDKETLENLIILLAPFVPHISEELWQMLGHEESVFTKGWPTYDEDKMKDDQVEMPVQVNGKVRATITIDVDEAKDSVLEKARNAIESKLDGKNIVKEIYVPKKIINIVVK
ncbi:leucine--tRNA ligase [Vallitalea guaymasensis]|uniref:Leucine--tRNA ligase n=1 Tax=Vallitalea guaymasensis TaxID=1185412 RepID=A0A8J8M766_9FIRM|nr:leucine--tRNA ligase [Vallitalea guaymasensis]QUH27478.1 leucine--tRNA ligase [Vallitalea guaymasensis]